MPNESSAPLTHRQMAVDQFNRVWELMDKPDRTQAETDEMIHAAHASRHHWGLVEGHTPANIAMGEWQVSYALANARLPESALYHAGRCLDHVVANDMPPFYVGYAHEGLARAHASAGNTAEAEEHLALASEAAARVEDPQQRGTLEGDLAELKGSL